MIYEEFKAEMMDVIASENDVVRAAKKLNVLIELVDEGERETIVSRAMKLAEGKSFDKLQGYYEINAIMHWLSRGGGEEICDVVAIGIVNEGGVNLEKWVDFAIVNDCSVPLSKCFQERFDFFLLEKNRFITEKLIYFFEAKSIDISDKIKTLLHSKFEIVTSAAISYLEQDVSVNDGKLLEGFFQVVEDDVFIERVAVILKSYLPKRELSRLFREKLEDLGDDPFYEDTRKVLMKLIV